MMILMLGLIFLIIKCACFCHPKLEYTNKSEVEEKKHLNGSTEFKVFQRVEYSIRKKK